MAAGACTLAELSACHKGLRRRGKRGMGALGQVVEALGPGPVRSSSVLEARLHRVLAGSGLPDPVREHELPWTRNTPGRVDLAYPAARVLVEADSRRWHVRERDFEADRRRDREAQLAGWDVYRFTWEDLTRRPDEVVVTMRRALSIPSK